MAKEEATVDSLVQMIQRGELRLPEMQREYVWRAPRVRDLVDSLYRGYPSGAILVWETDEEVPTRDFAVDQTRNAFRSTKLLLDGQQRLTSLSAIIRGEPVTVKGRRKPMDLLFNLEHPEGLEVVTEVHEETPSGDASDTEEADDEEDEPDSSEDELLTRFNRMTFVVATNKLAALPQWIRVSEVFKTYEDAPFLEAAGIDSFKDPRYSKYSRRLARLRAIRDYVYRMDVLERSLGYTEVTEIFVRVNSLGAKLRGSDLALAQVTARWPNSLKLFQSFQQECRKAGFPLDLGVHLRTLVAFATGQSRFLTIGRVPLDTLQASWNDSKKGMDWALNFVRANCGIDSPALLSSPYALIVLALFAHRREYNIDPTEAAALKYWLLVANAKGRFTRGSSESILDQDLGVIRTGAGPDALIERLRTQVGRLDITVAELEGKDRRSSLFKTMFLAFRDAKAEDWVSGLAIAIDHSGVDHKLQFHHIFPKGAMKRKGVTGRIVDDIANLCFIGGKTNRGISDTPPAEYIERIKDSSVLEAQQVPVSPELLSLDSYPRFLAVRRVQIAERLNEYLSSARPPAMVADGAGSVVDERAPAGATGVLIVEGNTDREYIEVAAEKSARPELLSGLRVVVGAGVSKTVMKAIREKQDGLPIVALFDSDPVGRSGKDKLKSLGFDRHEVMTYGEALGHPSAEVEAEDLWPESLLERFVQTFGEEAVMAEKRHHPELKRWSIGLNAHGKDLISDFLREHASAEDAQVWVDLLTSVRSRMGMQ